MHPPEILEPLPVADREVILDPIPLDPPRRAKRKSWFLPLLGATIGWAWRIAFGAMLCMSYAGGIFLVGWLNRLVQGVVLYTWYLFSPRRQQMSWADFRASLGHDAPVVRPRFFLRESFAREHLRAQLAQPTPDGDAPGLARQLVRIVCLPFASFFANLKMGVLGVLATFLLAGWGTALMVFAWEFGWRNSFHKGYEDAFIGPLTGLAGIALFSLAMLYVPMAQAHMAATGDFRAFFDFRFVWRLIRARLTAYTAFAALFAWLGLMLEILKTAPAFFDGFIPQLIESSDAYLHAWLTYYYLICGFFLFGCLVVTRVLAGLIYSSAVLKVIRKGRVSRDMVHPRLTDWLDRLDMYPAVESSKPWLMRSVRATGRWTYRRMLFPTLFVIWVLFTFKVYVGEFFNYHPVVGFGNHPLIQIPCVNYIPAHLTASAQQEPEA